MTNFTDFLRDMFKGPSKGPEHSVLAVLMARAGMPTNFGSAPLREGIPASVLGGCKKQIVVVPGTEKPALGRDGKPMLSRMKGSKGTYQVMDSMGIDRKRWKQLVYEQKRAAAGRYVGPFNFPEKAA